MEAERRRERGVEGRERSVVGSMKQEVVVGSTTASFEGQGGNVVPWRIENNSQGVHVWVLIVAEPSRARGSSV